MDKHSKEKQRYYVQWALVAVFISLVLTGVYGYVTQLKEHHVILVLVGEVATLLGLFFGFNMTTKVKDDV